MHFPLLWIDSVDVGPYPKTPYMAKLIGEQSKLHNVLEFLKLATV